MFIHLFELYTNAGAFPSDALLLCQKDMGDQCELFNPGLFRALDHGGTVKDLDVHPLVSRYSVTSQHEDKLLVKHC